MKLYSAKAHCFNVCICYVSEPVCTQYRKEMGRQARRDSGENQSHGMRRDRRDGAGWNRLAVEHPRLWHTLWSVSQVVRYCQQGPAAFVHWPKQAHTRRPSTPTHGKLFFCSLYQVKLKYLYTYTNTYILMCTLLR